MLKTHCLFLCPSSTNSAPENPSFLLYKDRRLLRLGGLSEELLGIWDELTSTGVAGPTVLFKPGSSNWQQSPTSIAWLWIDESLDLWSLRSLHSTLLELSSQTHSSESLTHFIWTSISCFCSAVGFLILDLTTSLRAAEEDWLRMNLLLLHKNRLPPPPPLFPCCLLRLPKTPPLAFDSSESSELPSYGSKNYTHEHKCTHSLTKFTIVFVAKIDVSELRECLPRNSSHALPQACGVMAMFSEKSDSLEYCLHSPAEWRVQWLVSTVCKTIQLN